MLLTILALGIGAAIGRIRGGSWSGVTSARINGTGWLVFAVAAMLVLNILGPAFPLVWALLGTASCAYFGLKNLQLTGMITLLIGLVMNLAPILANGAVPVSDLALQSVGQVDDAGAVEITGLRESTETATAFTAFGDVIPVPIINTVISIGDIVMLVALADIATNLFLRSRRRDLDYAGVTFAESDAPEPTPEKIAILSPANLGVTTRPAHAAHRRPRRKAAPSTHIPAHAKEPVVDLLDDETVIVLDGPDGYIAQPPPPTGEPVAGAPAVPPTEILTPVDVAPSPKPVEAQPEAIIDLTDPADRRPIIDLTTSPSDAQLCEFLRRRALADSELANRPLPGPGPRRGRAPRRSAGVVDSPR